MEINENVKKSGRRFLIMSVCVLVISTLMIWALGTSFGNTKVMRVNTPGENGATVSYSAWIPRNATNKNPAPVLVLFPGRSSNGHQLDCWSIEFARRGYVVINVDWNGNGETEIMSSIDQYVHGVMDSLLSMPFINKEAITVLGNSAGNSAATSAANNYPENVKIYIDDVHPMLIAGVPETTSILVIQAKADQYVNLFVGNVDAVKAKLTEAWGLPETVVEGKLYGSAADNTLRQYVVTNTIHQISALDFKGIQAACDFMGHIFEQPIQMKSSNQILGIYEIFQILGYAGIIMFILSLGITMFYEIPYFTAIGNAPTTNKGLRGKKLTTNVIVALLIPLVIFFPASWLWHNAEFLNGIMRSRNLRGVIGWLLTNAIITLIIIWVGIAKKKKNGEAILPSDYALCGEGEKVQGYKIVRAFILACIVVAITYSWVRFVEVATGLNYQIWNVLCITELTPYRMLWSIPIIICNIVNMFAANIGMNTSRRLAETGNEKKDMFKQVVLNVCVSAGVVTGLLVVQYGIGWLTTQYIMPQLQNLGGGGTSSGSLDFAFGFPLIMGFSAGMSTYFYKKTNNIWIGLFISAIFGSLVGMAAATLILPTAVM